MAYEEALRLHLDSEACQRTIHRVWITITLAGSTLIVGPVHCWAAAAPRDEVVRNVPAT
jgi:hypothetical protein